MMKKIAKDIYVETEPNTPAPGHDGPCVNAGDCCYWMCGKCESARLAARDLLK